MPGAKDIDQVKSYIGLDIATTMGIAIYYPIPSIALVVEVKGTPIEQYLYIYNYLTSNYKIIYDKEGVYKESVLREDITFVLEELVHFRNANTTRSLLERKGYIKFSLIALEQDVQQVTPGVARITFGKSKKEEIKKFFSECDHTKKGLTDNHTDALAVAIHQAVEDGYSFNIHKLWVYDYEIGDSK